MQSITEIKTELAERYVAGTLTKEDAFIIYQQMEAILGYYPVWSLCVDDVLDYEYDDGHGGYDIDLRREFADKDDLEDVTHNACYSIAKSYDYEYASDTWDMVKEEVRRHYLGHRFERE